MASITPMADVSRSTIRSSPVSPVSNIMTRKAVSIPNFAGSISARSRLGLLHAKLRRDRALMDPAKFGMDTAFLVMMLLTGLTGLLLMVLRETSAMGVMLAIHLGVVLSLFLTMPYG